MGISGVITFERGEYTEQLCISYNLLMCILWGTVLCKSNLHKCINIFIT